MYNSIKHTKMKNRYKYSLGLLLSCFIMAACAPQEDNDHSLSGTPDTGRLSFTATPSATNPNVIELKNTSAFKGGVIYWEMDNGSHAMGETAEAKYPFANTYTITMQVYNHGVPVTVSQQVIITQNDPEQINKDAIILAGGLTGSRTWVFDHTHEGHFGIGPVGGNGPAWWSCPPEGKAGCSLYDNEFTFNLDGGYNMTWTNKGKIHTNASGKDALDKPGTASPAGDFDVEYTPATAYTFSIDGNLLKLSNNAFFGHYAGTSTYKIVNISDNEFYIMCESAVESGNAWWYRFVQKK